MKKKVKKTNVPVAELVYGAMGSAELEKAVEKEYEMALQDRVMEETKEKKNAVEAYVYDMRNKVCWIACFGDVLICHHVQYLMLSLLVFSFMRSTVIMLRRRTKKL